MNYCVDDVNYDVLAAIWIFEQFAYCKKNAVAYPAAPVVTFIVSTLPVLAPDSNGRHGIDGSFSRLVWCKPGWTRPKTRKM